MGRHQKSIRQQQESLQSDQSAEQSEEISESNDSKSKVNQVSLAGKKRGRNEKGMPMPQKSDDECDDDELIDKLEKQ